MRIPQASTVREMNLTRRLPGKPKVGTTPEQFIAILRAGGVPGGIAYVHAGCSEWVRRELMTPENPTVVEALDSLAAAERSHRWDVTDGVVVLRPSEGIPGLLDTHIATIHLTDISNLDLSLSELLAAPEVVGAMQHLVLTYQGFRGGFAKLNRNPAESVQRRVDMRGITLLQGLNRIAREHGAAVWAYGEYECHGRTFQLSFISQ